MKDTLSYWLWAMSCSSVIRWDIGSVYYRTVLFAPMCDCESVWVWCGCVLAGALTCHCARVKVRGQTWGIWSSFMSFRDQTETIRSGWQPLWFIEPSLWPFHPAVTPLLVWLDLPGSGALLEAFVFVAPIIPVSYVKCTLCKCLSEKMEGRKCTWGREKSLLSSKSLCCPAHPFIPVLLSQL